MHRLLNKPTPSSAALGRFGVGAWEWDIREQTVRWSDELRDMFGLTGKADAPLPSFEGFLSVVHPDDRSRVMAVVSETIATRRERHQHYFRIIRTDGAVLRLMSRAILECDANGEPLRLTGIDIELGDETEYGHWPSSQHIDEERCEALEAMRRSEELYRNILQAFPYHIAIVDAQGLIFAVNDSWSRFAAENGAGMAAISVGANYLEASRKAAATGDPVAAQALRGIEDVLAGRLPAFSMDYPCHAPNREQWFHMTIVPAGLNAGGGVVIAHEDITARKAAETELRLSEKRFRAIFDNASIGVAIAGLNRKFENCNPAFCEMLGFTEQELREQRLFDVVHCSDREFDAAEVDRLIADDLPSCMVETRYQHKDGREVWVRKFVSVIHNPEGTPAKIILLVSDITKRRRVRQQLQESEERFRSIVNTAQEGIWLIDHEGRSLLTNPRMAQMLGATPEQMASLPLKDFVFPEDQAAAQERIADNLNGIADEFEWRFRRLDGTAVHVLAATTPLKDESGRVIGALGGFLDLTDRRRAEERQRVLMMELAHRGKNLLAVVQSVARLSFANATSLPAACEGFIGRLQALSRTYGSLTNEPFEGSPLDYIVTDELASFSNRIRVDGPKVMLTDKVAQTLALVVHELATNAVKYGALSVSGGSVDIRWQALENANERRLTFEWREKGGPPAVKPTRRGFGTTVLTMAAGGEFQCSPELTYEPNGFSYSFDAPLAVMGVVIDESPVRQKIKNDTLLALYDVWASQRGPDRRLPEFSRFDHTRFEKGGALSVATITADGTVSFVQIGRALLDRMEKALGDGDLENGDSANFVDAYRRCAKSAQPCYEYLRFDFGDGNPVTFERLLVPFSSGGRHVTHLAGIAVFTGAVTSSDTGDSKVGGHN